MKKVIIIMGLIVLVNKNGHCQSKYEAMKIKPNYVLGDRDDKKLKPKNGTNVDMPEELKCTPPSAFGDIVYDNGTGKLENTEKVPYVKSLIANEEKTEATIVLSNGTVLNYINGTTSKTGETEKTILQPYTANNNSEKSTFQLIGDNAYQPDGPITLKGEQKELYFNGNKMDEQPFLITANYKRDAIAYVGKDAKSNGYYLKNSNGKSKILPALPVSLYISPDGKQTYAIIMKGALKGDNNNMERLFYNISKDTIINLGESNDRYLWIGNNGAIFSVDNGDPKQLMCNGRVHKVFKGEIIPEGLFMNNDGSRMALLDKTNHLYFEDGTIFEQVVYASKVNVDGIATLFFLSNYKDGKLYFCKKQL